MLSKDFVKVILAVIRKVLMLLMAYIDNYVSGYIYAQLMRVIHVRTS